MSGEEATRNQPSRAERRAFKPGRSIKEQQLAAQMMRVYDAGKMSQRMGESDPDYFKRVRDKAIQVQRHQRRVVRRNERAARKRNRVSPKGNR